MMPEMSCAAWSDVCSSEVIPLSRAGASSWMVSTAHITLSLWRILHANAPATSIIDDWFILYGSPKFHLPLHYDESTQTKTSICPSFGEDETVMSDLRHHPCALAASRDAN
ncbi:hypothetical protein P171DRAFT_186140 [Karstenula rhodostoma CBS 690.94]|uniref:Uncharacterized protein n=1 Tax=Karstenula rhodostoma CBS 690.94 TaxID=1392251 RepID=A0A9P4UGE2_9PLEO|nr:hypothetical protein P171DRAFT_186140 [Karstenula rhodostoma CBS 690.94]